MSYLVNSAGLRRRNRFCIDPSVVRGLEYYTGPVYEVELLLDTKDEKGRPVRFGSVGGGGRYDGLVSRFRGEPVPATGFSIGVSRLQAALALLGKLDTKQAFGPVVVTVFDRDRIADYQKFVAQSAQREHPRRTLSRQSETQSRQAVEICRQAQRAVRRSSRAATRKRRPGHRARTSCRRRKSASDEKTRDEYLQKQAEAQITVPENDLVAEVKKVLARHNVTWG